MFVYRYSSQQQVTPGNSRYFDSDGYYKCDHTKIDCQMFSVKVYVNYCIFK